MPLFNARSVRSYGVIQLYQGSILPVDYTALERRMGMRLAALLTRGTRA